MELKLAKCEQIIKSWDYALSGASFSKKKKIQSNLTITNKRIIASAYNDISLDRTEIPLSSVKMIEGNFKKNRSFWAKVKLIIGIPLCLVIIGIPLVKSALSVLRGAAFDLKIITEGHEGSSLGLGCFSGNNGKKGLFARLFGKIKAVKVSVDKAMAKEILDELGAIVLDQQLVSAQQTV